MTNAQLSYSLSPLRVIALEINEQRVAFLNSEEGNRAWSSSCRVRLNRLY